VVDVVSLVVVYVIVVVSITEGMVVSSSALVELRSETLVEFPFEFPPAAVSGSVSTFSMVECYQGLKLVTFFVLF
jgi:hypothetical protein